MQTTRTTSTGRHTWAITLHTADDTDLLSGAVYTNQAQRRPNMKNLTGTLLTILIGTAILSGTVSSTHADIATAATVQAHVTRYPHPIIDTSYTSTRAWIEQDEEPAIITIPWWSNPTLDVYGLLIVPTSRTLRTSRSHMTIACWAVSNDLDSGNDVFQCARNRNIMQPTKYIGAPFMIATDDMLRLFQAGGYSMHYASR